MAQLKKLGWRFCQTCPVTTEWLSEQYGKRFPKAIELLENGMEDSLTFYALSELDARRVSSTNMLKEQTRKSIEEPIL